MLEHQTCFSLLALAMMKRMFPKMSGCAIICPSKSVGTFLKPVVLEWSAERVRGGGEQTFCLHICCYGVLWNFDGRSLVEWISWSPLPSLSSSWAHVWRTEWKAWCWLYAQALISQHGGRGCQLSLLWRRIKCWRLKRSICTVQLTSREKRSVLQSSLSHWIKHLQSYCDVCLHVQQYKPMSRPGWLWIWSDKIVIAVSLFCGVWQMLQTYRFDSN